MAHTKEPWRVSEEGTVEAGPHSMPIRLASGYIEGAWYGDDATDESRANARRIVACVNALEGYNPDAIADVVAALEACEALLYEDGYSRGRTHTLAKNALARLRSIDNA